jgi:hypothetical protein
MSKLRLHLGFTIPRSMVWAHFEGLASARDVRILSGFNLTFWWVLSGSGVMVKKKKGEYPPRESWWEGCLPYHLML